MLALLSSKPEPARAIAGIPGRANDVEIQPGQIVLRVGIAEIRRGIGEHLPRPFRIGRGLGGHEPPEPLLRDVVPARHQPLPRLRGAPKPAPSRSAYQEPGGELLQLSHSLAPARHAPRALHVAAPAGITVAAAVGIAV